MYTFQEMSAKEKVLKTGMTIEVEKQNTPKGGADIFVDGEKGNAIWYGQNAFVHVWNKKRCLCVLSADRKLMCGMEIDASVNWTLPTESQWKKFYGNEDVLVAEGDDYYLLKVGQGLMTFYFATNEKEYHFKIVERDEDGDLIL